MTWNVNHIVYFIKKLQGTTFHHRFAVDIRGKYSGNLELLHIHLKYVYTYV